MCKSCETLVINGVLCHEIGCPDAWMNEIRECDWCGREFKPEDRYQKFCSEECREDYNA